MRHLNNKIPENNNLIKNVHRDMFIDAFDGDLPLAEDGIELIVILL